MKRKVVSVKVIEDGDQRFIVQTFADGTEKRELVWKLPRRKRYPQRAYEKRNLDRTRKKGL